MPYLINDNTLAIIPTAKKSTILEINKNLVSNEIPIEIVSRNCQLNGSTLEGRQKGSSYLIGSNYKPPIVLNDTRNIILIPTHSIRNKSCTWISLNNILNYYPTKDKEVEIIFKNHKKIRLKQSYSIIDKQVLRATRLESILRGRNNKKFL